MPAPDRGPAPPLAPPVWLAALGLVAAVVAVFANTFGNDFVFDDFLLIVDHPGVRVPLTEGWSQLGYRPLRMMSYRLDFAIGGMHEWIFHLSNIVYHAFATLLVHGVLRGLGASALGAMAGALVFAVHPVQTESVTYLSGRRDLLCGLFYVAGFFAFLRARQRSSWLWLGLAAGGWCLALLSKEMAATLPVVCVLAHLFAHRRERDACGAGRDPRRAWIRPLLLLATIVVVGAIVAWLTTYRAFVERVLADTPWHGGTIGTNFATVARIWVFYLGLIVWPAHLSADYSFNAFPVSTSALDPVALAALALLVVLGLGALWRWRVGGLAGFGFAWFAVTLLPVSHIVPYIEMVAEHYLYIPLAGIAMVVADGVQVLERRFAGREWAVVAAILLVTSALGVRAAVRNLDWRDGPTLWAATLRVVPNCGRARFNLGQVLLRRGKYDEVERLWREGARAFPEAYTFPFALAKLEYRHGNYEEAYRDVKRAIRIRPEDPEPRTLAGWINVHWGRPARALRLFDWALRDLELADAGSAVKGRARAHALVEARKARAE